MSSLILSTIGYTLTVINSFIFLVCVIIFLSVYKRRGDKFTNKEKLNYNLCAAYIIYGMTSLAPAYGLYEKGTNLYYILLFGYCVCTGDLLAIYHFYVYIFSLSLKASDEHRTNLYVFIYFWSFLITVPLLKLVSIYNIEILIGILIVPMTISCCYIPIQIIRCWCKITKEYKKIELQDEEEKRIKDKNYNHLTLSMFLVNQILLLNNSTKH